MTLAIDQSIARNDNFAVLVNDDASGQTLSIDAPDAASITQRLEARGWRLDLILVTHHHADHVDGIAELKAAYGAEVLGPTLNAIPGLDRGLGDGDTARFGGLDIEVIATPGHTLDHLSYVMPAANLAFTADTLFAVGCGRVFEGTPAMMWESLQKLAALPDDTTVYCGHEYTADNIRFALTVDPDNADLQARAREVAALVSDGRATLPTTIGLEKRINPFLRAADPAIRARLAMPDATDAEVFAEIRQRKDTFR